MTHKTQSLTLETPIVHRDEEKATPLDDAIKATPEAEDPLAKLAAQINEAFKAEDAATTIIADKRIEAGRLLLQAKERLPKGFDQWCKRYVKRSRSDIYKVMALASSLNPEAAREVEKTKARKGMAATRQARKPTAVSNTPKLETPTEPPPPERVIIANTAHTVTNPRVNLARQLANAKDSASTTQAMKDYAKLLRVFNELAGAVARYLSATNGE